MEKHAISFDHEQDNVPDAVLIDNIPLRKFLDLKDSQHKILKKSIKDWMEEDSKNDGWSIRQLAESIISKKKSLEDVIPYAYSVGMMAAMSSEDLCMKVMLKGFIDPKVSTSSSLCEVLGGDWIAQAKKGEDAPEIDDIGEIAIYIMALGVITQAMRKL